MLLSIFTRNHKTMASPVLLNSPSATLNSSPLRISKKTSENTVLSSLSFKQRNGISQSVVVSTHFKKTPNALITNSNSCNNGSPSSEETPIELKHPAFPTVMDINKIREFLPHRYPFLLVDRVIEYTPGVSVVGIKNVTINDSFFLGHFPERQIMPGVLMIEALAQLGGMFGLQPDIGGSRDNFAFTSIENVRFRKHVVPGDTLVMRMTLSKFHKRFRFVKMEGKAYVGGEVVCEGEFTGVWLDEQ